MSSSGVLATIVGSQSESPAAAHDPTTANSSNDCIPSALIPSPYATNKVLTGGVIFLKVSNLAAVLPLFPLAGNPVFFCIPSPITIT